MWWLLGLISAAPLVAWTAHTVLGLELQLQTPSSWLWALALAPILEETAMRPLLQTGLYRQLNGTEHWRSHAANVGTALVFSALHMPTHGFLALWWLLPALAIGEVWRRSSNWYWCTALHMWFNASLAATSAMS